MAQCRFFGTGHTLGSSPFLAWCLVGVVLFVAGGVETSTPGGAVNYPLFVGIVGIVGLLVWLLLESPLNKLFLGAFIIVDVVLSLVQLRILAGLVVLVGELWFLVYVWPIVLIDTIVGLFLQQERYTVGRWGLGMAGVPVRQWRQHTPDLAPFPAFRGIKTQKKGG